MARNTAVTIAPVRPIRSLKKYGRPTRTVPNSAGATRGWPLIVAGLLCLLTFGRRRRLSTLLVAMVALLAIGSVSGCTGEMFAPTTPNGAYVVTVTGTAQSVSASTSVTFTVKQ